MNSLLPLLYSIAAQVDSLKGTDAAQKGAIQRMAEPTVYDMVFPFIAFGLVILLPTSVALWVIFRTVTEKTKEADEV